MEIKEKKIETKILKFTGNDEETVIREAAQIIRKGGLVAFPTETVYGLGADAFNEKALKSIFKVKGRPADNPLIVHIAQFSDLEKLASEVPGAAKILAEKFWPGPLTIVLKKKKEVSPLITAGLATVALRIPAHPAALGLITEAKTPIAAPSANLSGKVSATDSAHVLDDLRGKIEAVIEGGSCEIGLESTVLDLSGDKPVILRPGKITRTELETVLGQPVFLATSQEPDIPAAPGMKYRHYAPRAPLILFKGKPSDIKETMVDYCRQLQESGKKVGILCTAEKKELFNGAQVEILGKENNLHETAFSLYNALRNLDRLNADIILAESFAQEGIGYAIMNRLQKAAGTIIDTQDRGRGK